MTELKWYSFEEWEQLLKELCRKYEGILYLFTAGKSHDGRNIYEVLLGRHKNCLICAAGIHGREWVNPVLLLHLIEEYAEAVKAHTTLGSYMPSAMLKQCSLCFAPLVNPDGYVIAKEGFEKITNTYLRHTAILRKIPSIYWKNNARGADINRNFPGKSWYSGNGFSPASELETKTLVQIFCSHPDSVGFLDFHSRGKLLYYYRRGMGFSYNRKSKRLAKTLSKACGYRLGRSSEEFLTSKDGGNSVHYYAEHFKKPSVTVETLGEHEPFPLNEALLQEAYEEIRLLPLICLDVLCPQKNWVDS